MPETPYIVKSEWGYRVMFISLFVSIILMFFIFDDGEFWNSNNYILMTIYAIFYIIFIFITYGLFIRRINFADECIIYRNSFGFTKIKKYKDIIKITGEDQNISIIFTDESLIKVSTSEANIHKVLRIIKKRRELN